MRANAVSKQAPSDGWDCHVHVFDPAAPSLPGHYQPSAAPLATVETLAHAHGVGRLVLVQPSVYGTDNRVLLAALAAGAGRHRGVAVVDTHISDAELDSMHAAGVRGVRFNLVSPVGNAADRAATDFVQLAGRLRARGWHAQWYAHPAQWPQIAALHAAHPLPCVLDHLAGLQASQPVPPAHWAALQSLADGGAWVKLSGWYRLGADAPYAKLQTHIALHIAHMARLFKRHLVWGSDWPHTGQHSPPSYASLWEPAEQALGQGLMWEVANVYPVNLYG